MGEVLPSSISPTILGRNSSRLLRIGTLGLWSSEYLPSATSIASKTPRSPSHLARVPIPNLPYARNSFASFSACFVCTARTGFRPAPARLPPVGAISFDCAVLLYCGIYSPLIGRLEVVRYIYLLVTLAATTIATTLCNKHIYATPSYYVMYVAPGTTLHTPTLCIIPQYVRFVKSVCSSYVRTSMYSLAYVRTSGRALIYIYIYYILYLHSYGLVRPRTGAVSTLVLKNAGTRFYIQVPPFYPRTQFVGTCLFYESKS
jgi:hypothetical protein